MPSSSPTPRQDEKQSVDNEPLQRLLRGQHPPVGEDRDAGEGGGIVALFRHRHGVCVGRQGEEREVPTVVCSSRYGLRCRGRFHGRV